MERIFAKRTSAAVLAVCTAAALCGCSGTAARTSEKSELPVVSADSETDSSQSTEGRFPTHISQILADRLKIDADVIFPEQAETGTAETASMADQTLWDRRNEIRGALIPDADIGTMETNEDSTQGNLYLNCESADQQKYLVLDGSGNLLYTIGDLSTHVENAIDTDQSFDTYNGDLYQTMESLPFETKEAAWEQAKELMQLIGITQVSDRYQCYVMDYQTMAEQEQKAAEQSEADFGKTLEVKTDWSEADNCYYFQTQQAIDGCPVLPAYQGEGTDEYTITAIVDQTGVIELKLSGYYPLEESGTESVVTPETIVGAVQKYYDSVITEDTWTVDRMTLGIKIIGQSDDPKQAKTALAWNCEIMVTPASSLSGTAAAPYPQYVTFYADNAKVIPE